MKPAPKVERFWPRYAKAYLNDLFKECGAVVYLDCFRKYSGDSRGIIGQNVNYVWEVSNGANEAEDFACLAWLQSIEIINKNNNRAGEKLEGIY